MKSLYEEAFWFLGNKAKLITFVRGSDWRSSHNPCLRMLFCSILQSTHTPLIHLPNSSGKGTSQEIWSPFYCWRSEDSRKLFCPMPFVQCHPTFCDEMGLFTLSNMVVTSHRGYWALEMWLVWLRSRVSHFSIILMNLGLNSHLWPVATILDSARMSDSAKTLMKNGGFHACSFLGWASSN